MSYKVSVVIPVYNCEKFIRRAVESVVNQPDSQTIQIILVDDGSTDNSGFICDELQKEFPNILVFHQKNAGVSAARNLGIEHAEGEWLSFLDSDDYLFGGFFDEMLAENNADLICCAFTGNSYTSDFFAKYFEEKIYDKSDFEKNLYPLMADGYNFFQCWNKLYKRSIVEKNNIRFPVGISFGEDMMFVYNYVKCIDNFKYVKKPLYYYYVNSSSATSLVKKGYEIYENIYFFLKSYFEDIGFKDVNIKHNFLFNAVGAIYTAGHSLNVFSAVFYIRKILRHSTFYEMYKSDRVYYGYQGVNGYLDKFIIKKQAALIVALVRLTERKSKKLHKEKNCNG